MGWVQAKPIDSRPRRRWVSLRSTHPTALRSSSVHPTGKSLRLIRSHVKPCRQKYPSSIFQKYMLILPHPASTGGAYRDRHGRRKWDAMDARMLSALARTKAFLADSEGVPAR